MFTKDDVLPELLFIKRVLTGDVVATRLVPPRDRVSYLQVQAINFRNADDLEALNAVRAASGALARNDEQAAYDYIVAEIARRQE